MFERGGVPARQFLGERQLLVAQLHAERRFRFQRAGFAPVSGEREPRLRFGPIQRRAIAVEVEHAETRLRQRSAASGEFAQPAEHSLRVVGFGYQV